MKLKHKLFSGYLTIVGLALFLCVLSLNGYRIVHSHFMATTQDILPGQQAMMNVKQATLAMVVESTDYLRTSDEIHVQFTRENIDDLREALRTHMEHEAYVGEAEKGVAEEMERRGLRLIDLCNDLIEAHQRGASEETLSQGREDIRLCKDELFEILDEYLAVHEQELLDAQDAIYRTIVNGFWTFLAAGILILAWGAAVAFYSAKTIIEPIHELERGAGIIGSGDLNYRLDIQTGDERTRNLRASEERFRTVLDTIQTGIVIVDAQTHVIVDANPAAIEMIGAPKEQIIGSVCHEYICPTKQGRCPITDLGQDADNSERVLLKADGKSVPVLKTVIPVMLDGREHLLESFIDITARVRAEEALQESEERFRAIFETAQDSIFIKDRAQRYTLVNPAMERLFELPASKLIGLTDRDIFGEEAGAHIREVDSRVLGGETIEEEHTKPVDGIPTTFHTIKVPMRDNSGEIIGLCGIARDITARKRAQTERERLLATEREQRLLAETLREVTLALTAQTSHAAVMDEILHQAQRIVPHSTANIALLKDDALRIAHWRGYQASPWEDWASDLVQPLAGWPLDAQVVRSRKPLVIPDTRQEPRWVVLDETAWIRSYLSVPICLRDRVLGLLRLDGDTPGQFSAEDARRLQPMASAAAIAIENARLVEGLEAEVAARTAEIRAEQEKNEAILRSVGHSIVMTNLDNRIQYVNEAFTTLTGYTAQDAIGQHLKFLFGEAMTEQKRQSLRLALAQGQVWQGETSRRRKDGRTYDAALTIAPLRDTEGHLTGYVSSHHDISHIKNLDRARSRFVTNVSHQLRTPVATLKTSIYLLRKGTHPEKADRYLQMMEEEIAQLIDLIQDILEMATLDSGKVVDAWEPVSLPIAVADIVTRFHDQAEASGLTLGTTPIPPDLPVIKGDYTRLFQALEEIVENAIIFTPAGGQVTVEVETIEDEGWSWATITVRDTGPGISPDEQERVFDRFFRGRLAEPGHVPGTGLGLSITQEIMRAHGGRVTVESESGQGSAFTLWLRSAPR